MTGAFSSILQPLPNDISSPRIVHDQCPPAEPFITPLFPPPVLASSAASQTVVSTLISSSTPPQSSRSRDSAQPTSSSLSRPNRLSIAAIAREKAAAALANLSVRSKTSAQSLLLPPSPSAPPAQPIEAPAETDPARRDRTGSWSECARIHVDGDDERSSPSSATLAGPRAKSRGSESSGFGPVRAAEFAIVPSAPSGKATAPATRPKFGSPGRVAPNKMHQTSSRLLRMTDEERPFTRDFEDLFSTLMVSLPLCAHRVRFQKVEHTFTSEEAINNLGSLKFSQSNRMPDPKDPSRIVTTTTTTTFSMAKEMARSVCQRFMDARFIETVDGRPLPAFPLKSAVWQLTPKGMHVLTRFCNRNGINQPHVLQVLDSFRNTMQLVILERDGTTDKLSHDRATIEVIFRRFAGQDGPNVKTNVTTSDSDSLSDYYNGLVGVKMAKERKIIDRVVANTFTGKAAAAWLMDCCTTVDRREVYEIADLFVVHGLIWPVVEDKAYATQHPSAARFQPTKNAIYGITDKGQRVAGWLSRENSISSDDGQDDPTRGAKACKNGKHHPRDSNNSRLNVIVQDPALRLLFREFLRDTHCEENLAFYLEVRDFTRSYDAAERAKAFVRLDAIRESLAAAYGRIGPRRGGCSSALTDAGLYNAFLAPGSPCELNIDHNLRNSLAGRMTRAVGDDDSMLKSLQEVVGLFRDAQSSVFKLMSSVRSSGPGPSHGDRANPPGRIPFPSSSGSPNTLAC